MTYDEVVAALVAARKDRGRSQAQTASRLGIHKQRLSHWETLRNRASPDDMARWAEALGLRVILELATNDGPATPDELAAAVSRLLPAETHAVVQCAQLLGMIDGKDRGLLLGYLANLLAAYSEERIARRA